MASRVAIFPGSFDPLTFGHMDIVKQSLPLFDKIVIGIGISSSKAPLLSAEERKAIIEQEFAEDPKVEVDFFNGLTVTFAKDVGAKWMIRGLRTEADFSYEMPMAETNRSLGPEIQTVFIPCSVAHMYISSSLVKEVFRHKGEISRFVPPSVLQSLTSKIV
ncbi:MAG: pantetheine-phosphate adenylyltransferase [Pseudobacteriovorax sp.]|nr:pantetheine-phosphate adenylyltransferase [Pseudobacteriovorax sp.]